MSSYGQARYFLKVDEFSDKKLELILRAKESEYVSTSESVGIRFRLHPFDEDPFPETHGQSVGVGRQAFILAANLEMSRLDFPKGTCFDGSPSELSFDYIYPRSRYTLEGCLRSLLQKAVLEECHCGDYRLPRPGRAQNLTLCPTSDPCYKKVLKEREGLWPVQSPCQEPCHQSLYRLASISHSHWPSYEFNGSLCSNVKEKGSRACHQFYGEETVKLVIGLAHQAFPLVKEEAEYNKERAWVEFSGCLSLWLGISILTLFETLLHVLPLDICRQG